MVLQPLDRAVLTRDVQPQEERAVRWIAARWPELSAVAVGRSGAS